MADSLYGEGECDRFDNLTAALSQWYGGLPYDKEEAAGQRFALMHSYRYEIDDPLRSLFCALSADRRDGLARLIENAFSRLYAEAEKFYEAAMANPRDDGKSWQEAHWGMRQSLDITPKEAGLTTQAVIDARGRTWLAYLDCEYALQEAAWAIERADAGVGASPPADEPRAKVEIANSPRDKWIYEQLRPSEKAVLDAIRENGGEVESQNHIAELLSNKGQIPSVGTIKKVCSDLKKNGLISRRPSGTGYIIGPAG